jgi:hypothetical protein
MRGRAARPAVRKFQAAFLSPQISPNHGCPISRVFFCEKWGF